MNYPHIRADICKDLEDSVPPTKYWSKLKSVGFNHDMLSQLVKVERDRAIRKLLQRQGETLWDSDGDPTDHHLDLLSYGYSPTQRRLDEYLDWLEEAEDGEDAGETELDTAVGSGETSGQVGSDAAPVD
jgi:hypothetical protein